LVGGAASVAPVLLLVGSFKFLVKKEIWIAGIRWKKEKCNAGTQSSQRTERRKRGVGCVRDGLTPEGVRYREILKPGQVEMMLLRMA